jgi:hypothetical protein
MVKQMTSSNVFGMGESAAGGHDMTPVTESPALAHALIASWALYRAKTGDGEGEGVGVDDAPLDVDDAPHAERSTVTRAVTTHSLLIGAV